MSMLSKFIRSMMKLSGHKKKPYKPQGSGQWINVGSRYNEEWVWSEKPVQLNPTSVCVYQIEDDFIIREGTAKSYAIDCVSCNTRKEVERATLLLKAKYKPQGNVIISNGLDV